LQITHLPAYLLLRFYQKTEKTGQNQAAIFNINLLYHNHLEIYTLILPKNALLTNCLHFSPAFEETPVYLRAPKMPEPTRTI